MRKIWMVSLLVIGVAGLAMSFLVSVSYLQIAECQLIGATGVSIGLFLWIFLSLVIGAVCLSLGVRLYYQGTPCFWDGIPSNRAFCILSINQFKKEGHKHCLVVPLHNEDAVPYYLRLLPHSSVPEGTVGHVIIKVNGKLQVFTREKLPPPQSRIKPSTEA